LTPPTLSEKRYYNSCLHPTANLAVSNRKEDRWMIRGLRFRTFLPIAECGFAALFGGLGLWQRSTILSRAGFGEGRTLWDSTARFHVWPWPFKFAVVMNTPAFLSWAAVICCLARVGEEAKCPSNLREARPAHTGGTASDVRSTREALRYALLPESGNVLIEGFDVQRG
jgi:hypothetical protein